MKKNSPISSKDTTIGITPVYMPFSSTKYTFENLENGRYYFKIGTGSYKDGKWGGYGNFSNTVSRNLKWTSQVATTSTDQPAATKVDLPMISVYEQYTAVAWNPSKVPGSYNAYGIMMKQAPAGFADFVDFTTADIAIAITPIPVPFDTYSYKWENLSTGKYSFKVCVGNYDFQNKIWKDYGNFSDTKFWEVLNATASQSPTTINVKKPLFSVYENNIGVIWEPYTGSAQYNAYAVFQKKDADFVPDDIEVSLTPAMVTIESKPSVDQYYAYTAWDLTGGTYYFKVCTGNWDAQLNQFKDYGNCSTSNSWTIK